LGETKEKRTMSWFRSCLYKEVVFIGLEENETLANSLIDPTPSSRVMNKLLNWYIN